MLTTRQRAYLRGLAQPLRPQLFVGHAGFSEALARSLEELFVRRELVKGRVLNTAVETASAVAEQLAEAGGAEVVGVVGRTFVLYRRNPDVKDPIHLPPARAGD